MQHSAFNYMLKRATFLFGFVGFRIASVCTAGQAVRFSCCPLDLPVLSLLGRFFGSPQISFRALF